VVKKILKNQTGFALVATLLGLALVSILGIAIINATSSNLKQTKLDSQSQSTYYIAESGIHYAVDEIYKVITEDSNHVDADLFFHRVENIFQDGTLICEDFGLYNKEEPLAIITLAQVGDSSGDTRDYAIESTGKIGNSTRKVGAVITINRGGETNGDDMDDIFLYMENPAVSFAGNAINGENGTIVFGGLDSGRFNQGAAINVTKIYIDGSVNMGGGSTSLGSKSHPGYIYVNGDLSFTGGDREVYGDVIINGDLEVTGPKFNGDVYVKGNVHFGNYYTINKNVYYLGNASGNISSKAQKLDDENRYPDFIVPTINLALNDKFDWSDYYHAASSSDTPPLSNVVRILAEGDYTWSFPGNNSPKEVIIISKSGDIRVDPSWGNLSMKGLLIALEGRVTLGHFNEFSGVVIAKDGFQYLGGGTKLNILHIRDFFPDWDENKPRPLKIASTSGSAPGNEENGNKKVLEFKSPIREKSIK